MLSPQLLFTLFLLAIADSLNPTLFAKLYLLTTVNPTNQALAFAMGVFFSTMIGSSILVFGLWRLILLWVNSLESWHELLQGLLGITLLLLGVLPHRMFQNAPKPLKQFGITATFIAGMMATASDVTALPLWVATEQMAQARLTGWQSIMILLVYNLIYVFPLLLMVFLVQHYGQGLTQRLTRFNVWVARLFPWILRSLTIVIGLILLVTITAPLNGWD